jgi:hypothetical protein
VIPLLMRENPAYAGVATVGFVLLTWFFYTAILAKAKAILSNEKISTQQAFQLAKERYLWILGSNIIFFTVAIFLVLTIFTLNVIFDLTNLHPMYLILSVMISLVIFVYLYFAIPEIASEKISLFNAFERSIRLVRHHWWHTFIVLGFFAAVILGFEALGILFTGKNRMILFTAYHFLLQLLFYPLIIAATLVLLNDLKLRIREPNVQ